MSDRKINSDVVLGNVKVLASHVSEGLGNAAVQIASLTGLDDVAISNPQQGEQLLYQGGTWQNASPTAAPAISGGGTGQLVVQTSAGTTGFVSPGTSNQLLVGGTVPSFTSVLPASTTIASDPTSALGLATKQYVDSVRSHVDSVASGLDIKPSVLVATTANIVLSGDVSVDGILVTDGKRVLVKNQTNATQNGIYTVTDNAWVRSSDTDTWAKLPGAFVLVERGTTLSDTGWVCTVDSGGTLGSVPITWSQFSGVGMLTQGSGITISGNQVSLNSVLPASTTVAADPTVAMGLATKQYVDNTATGLAVKVAVKVATISNIALAGLLTVDGVVLSANDRVLVKNQLSSLQNGIYLAAVGAWSRALDMDTWSEFPSSFALVESGDNNSGTGWVCTVNPIGTLETTPVTWSQFSSSTQITPGAGIVVSGNQVSLDTVVDSNTGTLQKVAVDSYGRVTGTVAVQASDLTTLIATTALAVTTTMTGDPTIALGIATKQYVDSVRTYVDTVATGLDVKQSVRAATTANISLTGLSTVDGVTLTVGDRVLVKAQTNAGENGIYVAASGAWTRATDANTELKLAPGSFCFIEEGSTLADTGWVLATNNPISLGVTALTFSQFNGASGAAAGAIKLASTDSTPDYLSNKLVGSAGIVISTVLDGGVSKLRVALDSATADLDFGVLP